MSFHDDLKPTKEFFFGEKTPWEEAGPGLKRQMMGYDGKIMLVKVQFEKGAVGKMHKHYHSQVTYVESGSFDFSIGGVTKTVKGGDSVYIPPHVLHGAICTKAGILIDVFSPIREGFME